jgi:hypothetical protein
VTIPDLIEPIVGYRAWRVRDGKLMGVHYPVPWQPGEPLSATCGSRRDHAAPGEGCTCGIHATRDEEGLRLNYLFGMPAVYGSVKLWGKVVVHERGYRAEFGYPRELYVADERMREALEAYDIPVVVV